MARTVVGVNDAKAVKKYSAALAIDTSQKAYWNQRFMGRGADAEVPLQILTDLESDSGEEIKYDLLAELRMEPVEGDDILENKEEAQRFFTDSVYIDQARCGVNTGGRMTRKRTLHDLREKARRQQSNWWARFMDELCFIYLSGARGVNDNFLVRQGYAGRAGNELTAPTENHRFYGGSATSFANLAAADKMTLGMVDTLVTRAQTQGGGATDIPVLQPCKIDGEDHFCMVMHTWQEDDLRKESGGASWLDIQKALATAVGKASPIFKGGLGMYRNVVLHSHRNVIRFDNAGAGANVQAARALFLGSQAGVVAFGSPGTGLRFDWHEESRDNNNQIVITSSSIFGIKKTVFETDRGAQDHGIFALDTAAASR
ncbi:N4-gp56 family major capsid protein [Lampropedia aestuarii]|uniref:N4-gp56 family major capsid protein n=1 Tax=Lampropedia aestuarii TaxID=2562762 RepID=A0A4S5BMV5_9BURK|nr:N4-gp56 family major capsid protein [Lampropedia aestuarii]THJ32403.1 N4-gp56 family major capsid protein [Lampropedia aestuarii]